MANVRQIPKTLLGVLTRAAWPWARAWARPGYFGAAPAGPSVAVGAAAPGRVAVVACHWIGDTLWAAQVLPALRELWPGTEFTVFAKPFTRPLWRGLLSDDSVVDAAEVVSDRRREKVDWRALRALAARWRAREFDGVVDLTGNRYSAFFSFALRPGWSLGFDGGEWGWLYGRRVARAERPGAHLAERPWRVVEPLLGLFGFSPTLRPPEPEGEFVDVAKTLGLDAARPVGVIAPGAGWAKKRWPPEAFADAARRMLERDSSWQWVVTGSRKEDELCRAVAGGIVAGANLKKTRDGKDNGADAANAADTESAAASPEPRVVCAAGFPLGPTFALLSGCAGFLGNDSGLGHIAAAYARRVATIFTGETRPDDYAPLGPRARVFEISAFPDASSMVEAVVHFLDDGRKPV